MYLMKQGKKNIVSHWHFNQCKLFKSTELAFSYIIFHFQPQENTVLLDVKPPQYITIVIISAFLDFMIEKMHGFYKSGFPSSKEFV